MTEKPNTEDSSPDSVRTALYASDDDPVVLRPHIYDGIREYDQKLPNWWLFTFYITIVFFVVFWIAYYQFDFSRSDHERITATMAAVNEKKEAELQTLLADLNDNSLVTKWANSDTALANAQQNYTTLCSACHAPDLSATTKIEGMKPIPLPGLPLTDGQWKYGGRPMEIFDLIRQGTPPDSTGHNGAKMEAWGAKLSSKAIAELTAYIIAKNKEEFAKFAQ